VKRVEARGSPLKASAHSLLGEALSSSPHLPHLAGEIPLEKLTRSLVEIFTPPQARLLCLALVKIRIFIL